jgi:hypothetical protein
MATEDSTLSESTHPAPGRSTSAIVLIAGAALAAGAFLRFFRLDGKGLWLDEIFTVQQSYTFRSLQEWFVDTIIINPNPPLYKILMIGWGDLFGYSDFAVRLPSAIFATAAVIAFFLVLRWAFNIVVAANGTILLAFSWTAIFYAQEARAYAMLLLFSTLATGIWLRILTLPDSEHAKRPFRALMLLSVVASYVHLYGFILSGYLWAHLMVLALLKSDSRFLRVSALGLAVTVVGFAPWLAIDVYGMVTSGAIAMSHIGPPGINFLVDIGAFLYHHPVPALLLGVGPVLLGLSPAARRIASSIRRGDQSDPLIALAGVIIVPFIALFVVSQFKPMLQTAYLTPFVPAVLAFVALIFSQWTWRADWQRSLILIAAAAISLVWVLPDFYRVRHKPQTREAVEYIRTNLDNNGVVLAPCHVEFLWGCDMDKGQISARFARYVHYLNYDHLPELSLIPEQFASNAEAAALARGFHDQGIERVFLIGSRGHRSLLPSAENEIVGAGYACSEVNFIQSTVHDCRLSEDNGR